MIKVFLMMKRRNDLTREQFLRHYKEIHTPLFFSKNVPGLRRYVQIHAVGVTGPGFDTNIDAIGELWFDDLESAQASIKWIFSSDETKDLREDSKLFINVKESPIFIGEEHILIE